MDKALILKDRRSLKSENAALYKLPIRDKSRFLEIERRLQDKPAIEVTGYQEIIVTLAEILKKRPKNVAVNRTLGLTLLQVCGQYNQLCLNARDYINYTLYLRDFSDEELCEKVLRLDRKISSQSLE